MRRSIIVYRIAVGAGVALDIDFPFKGLSLPAGELTEVISEGEAANCSKQYRGGYGKHRVGRFGDSNITKKPST